MKRTILTATLLASALTLAACGQVDVADAAAPDESGTTDAGAAESGEIVVIDDQAREVTIQGPVERAVVTLSYNNEFVQAIGAGDRVVGVDRGTVQRAPYLGLGEDDIVGDEHR